MTTTRPSDSREAATPARVYLLCERCLGKSTFRGIESRAKAESLHALVCPERDGHHTSPKLMRIDGQRPRITHLYG